MNRQEWGTDSMQEVVEAVFNGDIGLLKANNFSSKRNFTSVKRVKVSKIFDIDQKGK